LVQVRNLGLDPLLLGRSLSVLVFGLTLGYALWNVRRLLGWFGVAALATVVVSSPILASVASSATPDSLLMMMLVLPVHSAWTRRMQRSADVPSMGRWCMVGLAGVLALGLCGLADILCGRGKIENVFTNNDPFHIGLSMIMTGCAVYTLLVGTALAALCQRWADGRSSTRGARWWERGLVFLSIRVPLAALILAIYRMVTVYPAMERIHIVTACSWVALVVALVQVRLRHWEGQFFPILLVAVAVKISWVHALSRERDLERGSAILARAVAKSLPGGSSLESAVPIDSVFAYTIWARSVGDQTRRSADDQVSPSAGHYCLEETPAPDANIVASFRDPKGRDLLLVRREELARAEQILRPSHR
jgi:hypothetical protein